VLCSALSSLDLLFVFSEEKEILCSLTTEIIA
jgi:hypothetical protein